MDNNYIIKITFPFLRRGKREKRTVKQDWNLRVSTVMTSALAKQVDDVTDRIFFLFLSIRATMPYSRCLARFGYLYLQRSIFFPLVSVLPIDLYIIYSIRIIIIIYTVKITTDLMPATARHDILVYILRGCKMPC